MAAEIVSERDVARVFHLQCSCGATLVSTQKTVTCATCGKSLQVRRVRKRGLFPVAVEYHFACCFCGVAVVSPKKLATCANCGKTLQVLQVEKLAPRRDPSPLKRALTQDFERLCIWLAVVVLIICYFYSLTLD
jgi:hypothetical protein